MQVWVIPAEEVRYLRRPNGEPVVLGEGARWACPAAAPRTAGGPAGSSRGAQLALHVHQGGGTLWGCCPRLLA